jgi:hypothetical protein
MATSPFTPSRAALGDISNNKLFKSALKTPLSTVHESIDPIEHSLGQVLLPNIQDFGILKPNYSEDVILDYIDHTFPLFSQPAPEQHWQDPDFELVDREIEDFLTEGLKIGYIDTPEL